MNNFIKLLVLFLLLSVKISFVYAQDFGFSQYYYTPFLTNPALLASDNYINVRLHYRMQPVPDGQSIQTPMFSASMPLLNRNTGRRWGGAGISILQDKATNFMSTFGGMAAFAYNFNIGKNQLAIGLQAGYFRRTVDINNLSTSAQYQNGSLNALLPNGENLQANQAGFFNVSSGALFYKEDADGNHKYFVGIMGANLNQPSLKYSTADVVKVPIFFNAHAGYNLLNDENKYVIMPTVRYSNFSGNNVANIGSWFRYKLPENEGVIKKGTIGTGVWYNTNQALIASLEFIQPNYMLALSYDFSLSKNTQVWQRNGSTEITLGFRKKLNTKCKDTDKDDICDKEDECPNEFGLKELNGCPDRDKDGIPDKKDDCPDEFGLKELNGCPDRDGDGVIDKKDDCPDEKGLSQFNGCPDRDGDGIIDKKDDCPDEKGLPQYNGCPDRDGDTVIDKDDNCPDEKGLVSLKGCPEKKEEENKITKEEEALLEKASHVQFKTSEAVILPNSYPILDEVVALLKRQKESFLNLEGHTDSVGKPEKNLKLSQDRAEAVKNYFVSKGIDASRINAEGFGLTKPKTTNETAEGRAENRRVEMKLKSKK